MTSRTALRTALQGWRDRVRAELFDSLIPFWERHGIDRENGGYHDHLDRDGTRFDDKKHVGLQAQALWFWSRLVSEVERRPEWIAAAQSGVALLTGPARRSDGRMFATLTRDGRGASIASSPRNDLFTANALSEWARASGTAADLEVARRSLEAALATARASQTVDTERLPGAIPTSLLDTLTLAFDALDSYELASPGYGAEHERFWRARLALHMRPEFDLVLENVSTDGSVISGPEGRLVCPGRWLVAARQMFERAAAAGDQRGVDTALSAMESALDFGWDGDDGGLYLYLDRDGFSPVQIEWSRKLAWVHSAALLATLSAYSATQSMRWLERFEQVADYTFAHFPDPAHGDWFASLDRRNRVSQRFKSGPRKGGFSTARTLLRCDQLLRDLVERMK
jgi:N-acylglucosamine 2-epimerase